MLNERLYRRLNHVFGTVKVAKTGAPLVWVPDVFGPTSIRVIDYGETYRVNCPFCVKKGDPDHRYRLWISHAYGTEIRGRRRYHLATCFHNNCLHDSAAMDELRNLILLPSSVALPTQITEPSLKTPLIYSSLPGSCIKISELSVQHKSNQFLLDRGLNLDFVYKHFDVYYCFDSELFPYAIDKLVFPIYFEGKMVCWQCRYIGVPITKGCPKYFSPPGSSIKSFLYNYDVASQCDFVVVVEGILDVLNVGLPAVAIFGKSLSAHQQRLLRRLNKPTIIFLDPDASEEAEAIARDLNQSDVRIIRDAPNDPGKLSREQLYALVPELEHYGKDPS